MLGESAKTLSERFGKVLQKRESITTNRNDKSTSISTQLDSLIPASKISNLSQGMFVGAVSDNFGEEIEQKIFHAKIVVDQEQAEAEKESFVHLPNVTSFIDPKTKKDVMNELIQANYRRIKEETELIVQSELAEINAKETKNKQKKK